MDIYREREDMYKKRYEKTDAELRQCKRELLKINFFGPLVILAVMALSSFGTGLMTEKSLQPKIDRLVASQHIVRLTNAEQSEFMNALQSFVNGQPKLLDSWIRHLDNNKRWGILPALPEGYQNPNILVENGKPILCPILK